MVSSYSPVRILAFALVWCFVFSQAGAAADVRLVVRDEQRGARPESQRLLIASGKIRMDRPGAPTSVLLFDQSDNQFIAIDQEQRTFFRLDPKAAEAAATRSADARALAMSRLRERLPSMPQDERDRVLKMIQRMEQSGAEASLPTRYRVRSRRSTIAGFSCQWIDALRGGKRVRQICLADWRKVGLSNQDRATLKAMQHSLSSIVDQVGNTGMFQDNMPDGLPVHIRHFDERGRLSGEQILDSVDTDHLDPSAFEIPEGFEAREKVAVRP